MKALKFFLAILIVTFYSNSRITAQNILVAGNTGIGQYNIESSQAGFHFGLKVLPTFSRFNVKTYDGEVVAGNFTVGYGLGGNLNYYFSNHAGLQLEVIYLALAQRFNDFNDLEKEVKLSYITIPLLLTLNTNYGKVVNLNMVLGPQIGINTGARLEEETQEGVAVGEAVLAVKPVDAGVVYGAGLDFGIGSERNVHLNIGFRGVVGIVNIEDTDDSQNLTTNQYYILERSRIRILGGYIGMTFKL